jgi:hypothetical protein
MPLLYVNGTTLLQKSSITLWQFCYKVSQGIDNPPSKFVSACQRVLTTLLANLFQFVRGYWQPSYQICFSVSEGIGNPPIKFVSVCHRVLANLLANLFQRVRGY